MFEICVLTVSGPTPMRTATSALVPPLRSSSRTPPLTGLLALLPLVAKLVREPPSSAAPRYLKRQLQPQREGSRFCPVWRSVAATNPPKWVKARKDVVPLKVFYAVYLLPEHQRKGIGFKLTVAIARWLMDIGVESMAVWVLADNHKARRFYEALGAEYCQEREVKVVGADLNEVAYGWSDLSRLGIPNEGAE